MIQDHTKARLEDFLTGVVRQTETWDIAAEDENLIVNRLITEGAGDLDHDEVTVVLVTGNGKTAGWSTDPGFPFNVDMVLKGLPDDICDTIEATTGLTMKEARVA